MIDAELEARIDAVGRDAVFGVMQGYGWSPGSCPPKYCWYEACRAVETASGPGMYDSLDPRGIVSGSPGG